MSDPGFLTVTIPTSEFIRFCNTKAAIDAALECARVRGEALRRFAWAPDPITGEDRCYACGAWRVPKSVHKIDCIVENALVLQPTDPALAEVIAAREARILAADVYCDAANADQRGTPEWHKWLAAWTREDAARRKLGGGA